MKVISPQAYTALREALPLIVWHKDAFETYLRAAFGQHPEVLSGIRFQSPKREIAGVIMSRLMMDVHRYRETTIEMMLDIAGMERFSDIEKIKDQADRDKWRAKAEAAVAELRRHVQGFTQVREQQAKRDAARVAQAESAAQVRQFADDVADVKSQFVLLHQMESPQERGRQFENLLNNLFALHDMQPRLSYSLENEQIDGSITFDTDDYIIEAKWTKSPIGRDQLDVLKAKVDRRGKNALGIFISVSGFTSTALDAYRERTPFLAVDGEELFYVLDSRIRLEDLLLYKKRHANETGSCMLHAREWLVN